MLKKAIKSLVKGITHLMTGIYRIKIINKDKLPKHGPVIVVLNHRSYFDICFILSQFKEEIIFLGRKTVKNNPFLRLAAWSYDVILVERDGSDAGPLKHMLKVLKQDGMLGIFPEGTRNGLYKNKGKMQKGAAYVAIKTKVDIVPVGINGSLKPFRKDNYLKIGDRFNLSTMLKKGKTVKDKDEVERLNEVLKLKILELVEDGYYDEIK